MSVIRSVGPVIGQSRFVTIDRLIYVVPSVYGHLPDNDRYAIARLIGQILHLPDGDGKAVMLLGSGPMGHEVRHRWEFRSQFAEVNYRFGAV